MMLRSWSVCCVKASSAAALSEALAAAGSFLLGIVGHVNGCKNIIRLVSSDRLPPLVPAATGEGMGAHINLPRNP